MIPVSSLRRHYVRLQSPRFPQSPRASGDEHQKVALSVADVAESWNLEETLSLNEALRRLKELKPTISEVVQLRFFAGLSIEDTAKTLGVSKATVKRRWDFGRTWLFRELNRGKIDDLPRIAARRGRSNLRTRLSNRCQ